MSSGTILILAVAAVAALELVAIVALVILLRRERSTVAELRSAELARPLPGVGLTGRAVKAMVETAVRVREQGVGGMLMSSLDDLTRWATEDRAEIAEIAAPDGTVTIFFSDIEDSTVLNERLGDERWVRLLGVHDRLVRAQVAHHHGHIVKSQGDGFMIVFPEAEAAVRAAIGIQTLLRTGPASRLRRASLRVRVGIHVGTVVSRDGDYFGRNVAMTARVAALAAGGEILVTEDVRAAVGEKFVLASRGDAELKGFAEAQALWAVVKRS